MAEAAGKENTLVAPGTELSAPVELSGQKKGTWISRVQKPKLKLPAINALTGEMVWQATKDFCKDPVNVALVVWAALSIPACLIIMLVKLGLLNKVLDHHTQEQMDEIATQIVNALFALTCLIIFPLLCRHTFLLFRWSAKDKVELRQAFCKNGKRKPHDRTHIAMVVLWGQITCWATLAFSIIYWVYPLGERPAWLVAVTFVVSMISPVIGMVYLLVCPLSKDYDIVKEGDDNMIKMYQRTSAFFVSDNEIKQAEWNGTVFPGCCSDKRVACLVCILPCCMFGYNMERLGFGHKLVHALAFIIVLMGPILVFQFSAVALEEMHVAPRVIYYCGVLLAFLGLAYGGLWRTKMRRTYHLPGSAACCGSKSGTDIWVWICCSFCALCQEIRTADQYQVGETEHQYSQAPDGEAGGPEIVAPEDDMEDVEDPKLATTPPQVATMEPEVKAHLK